MNVLKPTPYSLFGLRKALRALRGMSYDMGRWCPSILVEKASPVAAETPIN